MTTMLILILIGIFINVFMRTTPVRQPMTDIEYAHADLMFRKKSIVS